MSRWLWALLAGVVLIAITAVFWVDQTSVLPPVSRSTTPVAPAPSPAQTAAPSPPPSPSPPAAQEAAAPPARALAPDAGQQASAPPAPSPEKPAAAPIVAKEPAPPPARAPLSETPLPPPAPGREAQEVAEHICAQEPRAAGRDVGLFRSGLRAPLPAAQRRLGLSAAGGQVRPGRDCRVAEENPSPFRHLPD